MTLRRVRIEDDGGAYAEHEGIGPADDAAALNDCHEQAEDDAYAEREALVEVDDDVYAEPRATDLAQRAPVPSPRHEPRPLTRDQERIANDWADLRFHDRGSELAAAGDVVGADLSIVSYEDMSKDDATLWLRENDPAVTPEGVAAEVEQALADAGLSLAHVRGEAFKGGRPPVGRRALRERVRTALVPMWQDGRRRTLMADALGCKRKALYDLMPTTR
jgi:hypothetical protein